MCILSTKLLEKRVAEKDIEVIKLLYCNSNKLLSPYMSDEVWTRKRVKLSEEDITWKLGETKTVNLGEITTQTSNLYLTSSGLYSISDPGYIKHGSKYKLFKAIIPAGSEYYTDGNQFCSNSLKIIEEVCV